MYMLMNSEYMVTGWLNDGRYYVDVNGKWVANKVALFCFIEGSIILLITGKKGIRNGGYVV